MDFISRQGGSYHIRLVLQKRKAHLQNIKILETLLCTPSSTHAVALLWLAFCGVNKYFWPCFGNCTQFGFMHSHISTCRVKIDQQSMLIGSHKKNAKGNCLPSSKSLFPLISNRISQLCIPDHEPDQKRRIWVVKCLWYHFPINLVDVLVIILASF